jgi:hypothetical protein
MVISVTISAVAILSKDAAAEDRGRFDAFPQGKS